MSKEQIKLFKVLILESANRFGWNTRIIEVEADSQEHAERRAVEMGLSVVTRENKIHLQTTILPA
jgi:hypothetical protein